jgi:hypothetical protein
MMTPALAIGWTIWRRHRWGLVAASGCVAVTVIVSAIIRAVLDPVEAMQACAMVIIPLVAVAMYFAGVFAYGFDIDVAANGTAFPGRMFTLPVRTGALAGWPMAFGGAAVGLLWVVTAGLILRPAGLDAPVWWPALVAAAQLTWVQAVMWWPFGLAFLRVLVGMLVVHVPVSGTMLALKLEIPEPYLLVFLGVALVSGVGAALVGVARSRRGSISHWAWLSRPGRATAPAEMRRPFYSPGQALRWFERRRHGTVVPLIVAVIMPLCLLPLFLDDNTPPILARTLGLTFLVPVFFAGMAGGTVGKNNPWVREYYGVSSYAATRPVTTAQMVAAKLRAGTGCTLLSWGIVAMAVTTALFLSGTHRLIGTMIDAWLAARAAAEVIATAVVVAVLLLLWTWKRTVESLVVGLTGREWFVKGSTLAGVFAAFGGLSFGLWLLIRPEYHDTVRELAPWLMAVAVGLKLLLAGLAIRALRRKRLVSDRTLAVIGATWIAVASSLVGLLAWVIPGGFVPATTLLMGVVLLMPLARLSAMPLALDWNRHR